MSRHTAISAVPAASLWTSMETAARVVVRYFAVLPETSNALATMDHEQNLIRRSGRHWLIG